MPLPTDRPDFDYWTTPWQRRPQLSQDQLAEYKEKQEAYSRERFKLRSRFRLKEEYNGIPSGVGCTVIRTWPDTKVRWDKWDTSGRGSTRPVQCVSFELDMLLYLV